MFYYKEDIAMSTPREPSKSDECVANRNRIRRQLELHRQDTKIKKNMLKVLFLMLFLISLAAVSVSDGVSVKPAINLSSHDILR